MQISKVVLYSHDGRVKGLDFKLGALNIITGRKGTGKSALIRILEYCLGSAESRVPHGTVRDCTSWYGVLLSFEDTQMFIARAEPKPGARSSTNVFINIGNDLGIPSYEALEQNSNTEALVDTLTQRLGIPNIETQRGPLSTQEPYNITIAHALFFNFLRQDEIAKPTQLFHRQDEQFVDAHIRDVLPYFLGAVDENRLTLLQELRLQRTELRRLERELERSEPLKLDDPRATSLVHEAIAVGLAPRDAASNQPLDTLRRIDAEAEPQIDIEGLEVELDRLRDKRDGLLGEQRAARNRIEMLRSLNREEVDYDRELDSQRVRLRSIDLFSPNGEKICPICHQSVEAFVPSVGSVRAEIERLSSQLENMNAARPRIEGTIGDLEAKAASLRHDLQDNQSVINSLQSRTERLREYRDQRAASAVVRGRIQFFLETITESESVASPMKDRLEAIRDSIKELEQQAALENIDERMESMLRYIEDDMTRWATELDLEHKVHVRLAPRRLTVIADTRTGPVSLDHMGSGANWVGYHVVTYAALHHWFELNRRPVPRFIVFDQPTQVFYPPESDNPSDFRNDDDRKRVHELFGFLGQLPSRLDNKVQIIVTDHAVLDDAEFQNAVIANWHNDQALVPADWPHRPEKK